MRKYGDRQSVWCGEAEQTRYGLTKDKLVMSKGKIVSKVKHDDAVQNKTAYLSKLNSKRQRRAPAPVVIRSSAETAAISVPGNRVPRAEPTRESRLKALTSAANRTY